MTAKDHAERASRLLDAGLTAPAPVIVQEAMAHAQAAIALQLTGGKG